ncbi:type 2 periplasmic-binding domain-containing protein [Kiloniella litopenaei]|uniref:hypothetical protein n=1 Tax=Kiloniella litopenaei TaxID=1549748 RepID=UPI00069855B4|nr:hypothetical protein [Kiloniella litopenaei]
MKKCIQYFCYTLLALLGPIGLVSYVHAGEVRDRIEDRGYLRCGVIDTAFFNKAPVKDMGTELCRGLALALFPNPNAVKLVTITESNAGRILAEGAVDVLALADSKRLSHQGSHENIATLFHNSLDVAILFKGYRVADLNGKKICSLESVDKTSLAIFGQKYQISFGVVSQASETDLLKLAKSQRCRAVALPRVEQSIFLNKVFSVSSDPLIFSTTSSANNLGMVVSSSDKEWQAIVRLYAQALLESERRDIHSQNVDYVASSTTNPEIQKLLGVKGSFGDVLGLDNNWFYRVLQRHGNYQEIYQRHFNNKGINLERGPNQLTAKGGKLRVNGFIN